MSDGAEEEEEEEKEREAGREGGRFERAAKSNERAFSSLHSLPC